MNYRQRALIVLGTQFGVDRERVKGLIQHYMTLKAGKALEYNSSTSFLCSVQFQYHSIRKYAPFSVKC